MGVKLQIPDSVVQAIRLPEDRIAQELRVELAIALYAQGLLSFGKARELAERGKYEFGRLLGERGVPRHYGADELEDDVAYARGSLGLKTTGVLGILLRSQQEGKLPSLRNAMDELREHAGFHIRADLYVDILKESGES